jgi:hypothetical protein
MYAKDPASSGLGMRITKIAPGQATLTMRVRPDMLNGHGICHGGFTFALADSAFAFACNTYNFMMSLSPEKTAGPSPCFAVCPAPSKANIFPKRFHPDERSDARQIHTGPN